MSEVLYISRKSDMQAPFMDKLRKLIRKIKFNTIIKENDHVAIKLHFGEPGITTYLRPIFVKPFVDEVKRMRALPFLTDANTLYKGKRSNGIEHIEAALKNGFNYISCGAPVIIADGLTSENYVEVDIKGEYFDRVKIAGEAHRASSMLVLSHFKGHEMVGFGGAIKNIGMGLANKTGKLQMHSTAKPFVKETACRKCGVCLNWCPVNAITMHKSPAKISEEICIGCGQCIMSCPHNAINLRWDMDFSEGQCKISEYALGVVKPKLGKIWFFNFLLDITPDCDCYSHSDIPIVPDIGILASKDPVALDQASYDLVSAASAIPGSRADGALPGEDKFKKSNPHSNPEPLLAHAEKIGLGTRTYKIVQL